MGPPPSNTPRIEDGVNIAYPELGEGAGLTVVTLGGFGSYWWLQSLLPVHLDFLQPLGAGCRVDFMEQRRFGLSGGVDDDAWPPAPADIHTRLAAGRPVRVVSTQVVEAGVDLDFPCVLRAMAPLDSLIVRPIIDAARESPRSSRESQSRDPLRRAVCESRPVQMPATRLAPRGP